MSLDHSSALSNTRPGYLNKYISSSETATTIITTKSHFFPVAINQAAIVVSMIGGFSSLILGPVSVFPYLTILWGVPPVLFYILSVYWLSLVKFQILYWFELVWQIIYALLLLIAGVAELLFVVYTTLSFGKLTLIIGIIVVDFILWLLNWRVFYIAKVLRTKFKILYATNKITTIPQTTANTYGMDGVGMGSGGGYSCKIGAQLDNGYGNINEDFTYKIKKPKYSECIDMNMTTRFM